jgi:hypothetical protein
MTLRLTVGGSPLVVNGAQLQEEGTVDLFNRPDGPVGTPWEDAHSAYPTLFDEAVIRNYQLHHDPTHDGGGEYLVGHVLICQETHREDDFEVGAYWSHPEIDDVIGQIMPAACIAFDAPDLRMGVAATFDIAIPNGSTYIQNVFRTDPDHDPPPGGIGSIHDTLAYYRQVEGTGLGEWPDPFGGELLPPPLRRSWIALRVVNGEVALYWEGERRGGKGPLPDWAAGRTKHGLMIIGTSQKIGQTSPFTQQRITEVRPDLVDAWYWRPYSGPL